MFMRFKASDLGLLVRPRTITRLLVWKKEDNLDEWWKQSIFFFRWRVFERKNQLAFYYRKSLEDLFQDLSLGKPSIDPGSSYVCKVVSFVILHKGSLCYLDTQEKADLFENEAKKRFGQNAFMSIVAVGLKFYKNIKIENNVHVAGDPWEPTERDDLVWFYSPKDIIPLENVIEYESISPGDYISLRKVEGIAIFNKDLTKPKFYAANSCVSNTVSILSNKTSFVRITPDKKFKVTKKI